MFQVHGLGGRLFTAPAETLRRAERIAGTAATPAIEADEVRLSRQVGGEPGQPAGDETAPQRAALRAYAELQGQAEAPASPRRRPRVSDWMSRPARWLPLDPPVGEAMALLDALHIEQAPVLDAAGHLVGLLLRAEAQEAPAGTPVSGAMVSPVPAASPDTDLRQLSLALLNTGLPGMPVTGPQGELIGFITRGDVLRAVATEPALDLWG